MYQIFQFFTNKIIKLIKLTLIPVATITLLLSTFGNIQTQAQFNTFSLWDNIWDNIINTKSDSNSDNNCYISEIEYQVREDQCPTIIPTNSNNNCLLLDNEGKEWQNSGSENLRIINFNTQQLTYSQDNEYTFKNFDYDYGGRMKQNNDSNNTNNNDVSRLNFIVDGKNTSGYYFFEDDCVLKITLISSVFNINSADNRPKQLTFQRAEANYNNIFQTKLQIQENNKETQNQENNSCEELYLSSGEVWMNTDSDGKYKYFNFNEGLAFYKALDSIEMFPITCTIGQENDLSTIDIEYSGGERIKTIYKIENNNLVIQLRGVLLNGDRPTKFKENKSIFKPKFVTNYLE